MVFHVFTHQVALPWIAVVGVTVHTLDAFEQPASAAEYHVFIGVPVLSLTHR